jgi:hypothetical protein
MAARHRSRRGILQDQFLLGLNRRHSSVGKATGDEGQKCESRMPTLGSQAQDQQQDIPNLKADARTVVASNSNDKAKTEARCRITDQQLDRADQEKNIKKRMDLSRLQKKLGPDHAALIHALKDIDPESPHGRELASIIESLDET